MSRNNSYLIEFVYYDDNFKVKNLIIEKPNIDVFLTYLNYSPHFDKTSAMYTNFLSLEKNPIFSKYCLKIFERNDWENFVIIDNKTTFGNFKIRYLIFI